MASLSEKARRTLKEIFRYDGLRIKKPHGLAHSQQQLQSLYKQSSLRKNFSKVNLIKKLQKN